MGGFCLTVLLDGISGIWLRSQEVSTLGCGVVGFQGILGHLDGLSNVASPGCVSRLQETSRMFPLEQEKIVKS